MNRLLALRAAIVSLTLLGALLFMWHDLTRGSYQGMPAGTQQSRPAMPGPLDVGNKLVEHLRDPFSVQHPREKGLVLHVAASLAHAAAGFVLATLIAVPVGLFTGLSPLLNRSLAPFIQLLRPIAFGWVPLALYFLKSNATAVVLIIFACALWPMLVATADGVAAVHKDWLGLARGLEVGGLRRLRTIVLPAAAPAIFSGMRQSAAAAWAAAIAAEMLAGGSGIGAFLWNEWYNLSFTNVVAAIIVTGAAGMALDQFLAHCGRSVSYRN